MKLEIEKTEVVSADNIQVEVPNEIEISEGKKDYEVSVVKKEYTIIGDSIFIPSMYEDAPPWLKEFIDTTIDVAVTNRDQSLINRMHSILTAIDYVPKNQYTEQINQIVSEDGIINSRIATLNSNFTNAINTTNATVAEINLTYASKDEAAAIANNVLTASLSGSGEIGSALIQLQEAYATLESTTAQNISMLESVMEGEINGNATAMKTIRTYVGIDESGGSTGTGLLADVSILQKQNDGIIETITGTYDVMVNPQDPNLAELVLTAEPYASWKAQDVSGIDTRLAHIGDVYIKYGITSNGAREYVASFKFIRTIVDASDAHKSTDADGFTWALIIDQAAQDAYNQALNAYDLADNKRRVFTITPSGQIDEGDLWVTGTNPQVIKVYKSGNWELSDTQVDNFVNNTYTPAVTSLQNQVDGKVESWFQNSTSDPKTAWTDAATRAKHEGDLWYQLDTKRSYWYSSGTNAWNLIDDEKAIQALANAAAAQTAANNAQTSANTANSLLADIASDNKLVPSEKVAVKKEWDIIKSEYTKNLAQGNVYGVSTSSYTSAYNSLSEYITPLLSSLTTTSDIVGTTFRSMFKAYYDANVDLLNAVANKINAVADGKITSYYIDTFSSLQALSNGWTTAEKASNVGDLATIWNDSTLDNNGTWRWNGTTWASTRDKKLVALASDVTNLSTELTNGTNTWANADSTLENSLRTEITGEGARVESKFAYNSTLMLNGTSYSSGFGIATSLTSGSGLPTGQSEFWIKADKFKLMSADGGKKSTYSPFTVDSVTGEINFNGKVTFSNVTNVPQLGSTPQQVIDAVNSGQTTTIDGSTITTGSVTSVQIKSDAALINKLNVTGGLVANNIVVPGINSNNPLFSASGSQVVISNLKVLGTVSMPGVTKIANSGTFSGIMPVSNSGNGSPAVAYAGYVYKPYVCNTWGIIIVCSVSNGTGTEAQKDLSVEIRVNGVRVGSQVSSSAFNNNTTTIGGYGTYTGEKAHIEILVGGYNTSGTYYGSFNYISAVEN